MLPIVHFSFERWRKNTEFGVYVSNQGRVRLIKGKRWLEPRVDQKGYLVVFTEKGAISIHRLVAYTWLGDKRNEKYTVDHINSNKRDNRVKNLRWVSAEINVAYARFTQFMDTPVEETKPQTSIEEDEVLLATMQNQNLDEKTRGHAALKLFDSNKLTIRTESFDIISKEQLERTHQKMTNGTSTEQFVGRIVKAALNKKMYCNHFWHVEEK